MDALLYSREDACRAWLMYARCRTEHLTRLLSDFESTEEIYDRTCRDGGKTISAYLPPAAVKRLVQCASRDQMHQMLLTMRKLDMGILSSQDAAYSDALRSINDPPPFLFYRGETVLMSGKCLTVIGSRKASPKGIAYCEQLCEELSNCGVVIVSGLAVGIDTAAHEGSLRGRTPCIGVMACGMDLDYPTASSQLREDILRSGGLLLSEMPPGQGVFRGSFQSRNRILSGLSRGVVMIEARIRSGSMMTVHHALDQGREVFAFPGEPGTTWSEGAHQLIREGARYFVSASDLLEDLGWEKPESEEALTPETEKPGISPEMHSILTVLHRGEKGFDELALETGLDTPVLTASLAMLQMFGYIRALPGKSYCVI